MASTGTAPARAGSASFGSDREGFAPNPAAVARVRDGARWFFWIATLLTLDAVVAVVGSNAHRFSGFGVTAMIDGLARSSASKGLMHLLVNGWAAAGLVPLGYCAAAGQRWAFVAGMAAFAVDAALLVVAGDYIGAAFHVVILHAMYLGVAAAGQPAGTERPDVAYASHAG